MSETTSLLTVKTQPSSNWKTIAKFVCCGAFTIAIANFSNLALAVTVEEVPNPQKVQGGWVTDMANVLSVETEADINRLLSKLEATNGSEIAIVTVPETSPSATPKEFATALFNYWGIGKKGRDNGVLFLISKGDRRVEIETGYGVEGILPDALVGNIIAEKITPQFKQGNFNRGTLNGTQALVAVLEDKVSNSNPQTLSPTLNNDNNSNPTSFNPNLESELGNSNSQTLDSSEQDDNWGAFWLWVLGLGGSAVAIVGIRRNNRRYQQVVAEPIGKLCPTCQQPMTKIDSTILQPHLSKPQQTAQNLGSVDFAGWYCINCYLQQNSLKAVQLERNRLSSSRVKNCPVCQELTVTNSSKVIKPATVYSEGRRLEIDRCHCCSYHKETEKTINKLPPPPPPSRPSSTNNIWMNNGGGGGYSGGGGGDWGGGSSGGGGAGGGF